jgi:hypothetical protein
MRTPRCKLPAGVYVIWRTFTLSFIICGTHGATALQISGKKLPSRLLFQGTLQRVSTQGPRTSGLLDQQASLAMGFTMEC